LIAKSEGNEAFNKEKKDFVDGAMSNGVNEKKARDLFESMSFFGSYAFNRSHAAAYSVIAYWGMHLKTYYPTEFFYGLMKHEDDREKITKFVVEARSMGIKVVMPDVNGSKIQFSVIGDKEIQCGLIDIKGVGDKAAADIVEHQPYTGLVDFCSKVTRRIVNRGVIKALIQSGAFDGLYSNMGALLAEKLVVKKTRKSAPEKIEKKEVWDLMIAKKDESVAREIYDQHQGDRLSEEDHVMIQTTVCPIPPPKHKIQYYPFVDKYIKTEKLGALSWENTHVIVRGCMVDIKYNNVGDFHKEEPSTKEKKRIRWRARYANVNVDDETGLHRCNVDIDYFPAFRPIIDKGNGTPVMISARAFEKSQTLFANVMVDLDHLRKIMDKKINMKEKFELMNEFEKYFFKHPTKFVKKQNKCMDISIANVRKGGVFRVIGLVMRIKKHWTKKNELMYFLDIEDDTGNLSMIVWPSEVKKWSKFLVRGNIVAIRVKKNADGSFLNHMQYLKTYWTLEEKDID